MSAADRMVVRTRSGAYRSLPRRTALGLIAAGRVTLEPAPVTPEPDAVTPEAAPVTPQDDPAPTVRITPEQAVQYGLREPAAVPVPPSLEHMSDTPDPDVPTVEAVELPPEPKPTARRGEWADYAESLGVEVNSTMTKREIQQAAEEAATSLTNLPQPALTGGRLETPEDEPATETVADDQDPRTR